MIDNNGQIVLCGFQMETTDYFFFNCDSICEVNVSELIYNRKCISIKLKFLLFPQKNL